ncbi:MAG: (d)CMP kinase [Myxococcales bacterium]|nr:(d)CMP kinase [Myxococcales bacterium]
MNVAVDGPGSAGKGTVARGVARALQFRYVDTGAMYRVVALAAGRAGVGVDDAARLGAVAADLDIDFRWEATSDGPGALRVLLEGEDVTEVIRAGDMGPAASAVSRHPEVRDALLGLQRQLAVRGGVVMDGRDIGTVVLPDAAVKVFLDASLQERAKRRHLELQQRGESVTLQEVADALAQRDDADRNRPVAPLVAAPDAVRIDTTHLSVPQAVAEVLKLVAAALRAADPIDTPEGAG